MPKLPQPVVEPRLLTIKQAAFYTATTQWFVRNLILCRQIPFVHLGRGYQLDKKDLDAFVESQKVSG